MKLNICYFFYKKMEAFLSEWSKESGLRSDACMKRVGSNPTECNFYFSLSRFYENI